MRPMVLAALTFAVACSPAAAAGGPEKACVDTADAIAHAAERCGEKYQHNYDAFVQVAAGGSCKNVTKVPDEAVLRSTCLLYLASAPCADLRAGRLDPTCVNQLQRAH